MREPIVVAGMGVVCPLGCSVEGMWRPLIASESGLRRLPDDIDAKVAGLVPSKDEHPDGFDPDALIPVKDRRKMDRFIQFTLSAADQALRQSGRQPSSEHERTRTATVIASGVGGFQTITDAVETVRSRGAPRLRRLRRCAGPELHRPGRHPGPDGAGRQRPRPLTTFFATQRHRRLKGSETAADVGRDDREAGSPTGGPASSRRDG